MNYKNQKGFYLIELLVVVSIIGFLATMAAASLVSARKKARDAVRLADMRQLQLALDLYQDQHDAYPENTDDDCGGWDTGFDGGIGSGDPFITPLTSDNLIKTPGDPITTGNCGGYAYYLYPAGSYNCDPEKGDFYVLGIRYMEKSPLPHYSSPGWSCPLRDWQPEFYWVTGKFIN